MGPLNTKKMLFVLLCVFHYLFFEIPQLGLKVKENLHTGIYLKSRILVAIPSVPSLQPTTPPFFFIHVHFELFWQDCYLSTTLKTPRPLKRQQLQGRDWSKRQNTHLLFHKASDKQSNCNTHTHRVLSRTSRCAHPASGYRRAELRLFSDTICIWFVWKLIEIVVQCCLSSVHFYEFPKDLSLYSHITKAWLTASPCLLVLTGPPEVTTQPVPSISLSPRMHFLAL